MADMQETPAESIISLRNVAMRFPVPKRYRELLLHPLRARRLVTALGSVNLEIARGDRIAVLGPNGAGKTTMLKLIGGLLLPSEGSILVNGHDTLSHNTAARQSVGFVMNEERSFFWRLNAIENLEFFAALDNLTGDTLRERSRELVRLVGLEYAAEKAVSTYSSGMKQRLALARGLIAEPDVLILDEPTRTLDPIACDELIDLVLRRIHQDMKKTILIATHRLEEAVRVCDKVIVVHEGRLKAYDRIDALAAQGVTLSDFYRRNVEKSVA